MAAADKPLPEGTDHVINGASSLGDDDIGTTATSSSTDASSDASDTTDGSTAGADAPRGAFFERFEDVKAQGYDRAREYAVLGKDRTTGALDDFIRMINDAAGQVDSKVGSQYGDYARRAAEGIASFNDALKGKDVDDLFTDAREMVAKAPAIAVGTAAALGFVVARLAKAGLDTAKPDKDEPSA
ncbi:hypothetical protein Q4F19_10240 [Sphingomonas sp. BIUV-7]|uniref:Uncharacterized protein n=1 Tax=Sphingomonas natans TaxID=3063330 RepID=A0ABT8Y8V0_9SPHN|nr:hypothetical protein [Sphingomonas sp. BIUV-7]MDO6414757.1 hypothetical protein [Sphingomonas sp. BIUV-7]